MKMLMYLISQRRFIEPYLVQFTFVGSEVEITDFNSYFI